MSNPTTRTNRRPSGIAVLAAGTMISVIVGALLSVLLVVLSPNKSHSAAQHMPRLRGTDGVPLVLRPPVRHELEEGPEATTITPDTHSPNYIYNQHNGMVQTNPHVYLIYWGNWSTDNKGVMDRLYYFYKGIGGSAWGNVMTQYQQGCTPGTWTCSGAHAGNPAGNFKGWYKDTSTIPTTPTGAQIAAEARKYAKITGDYSSNAQYVIALPPGHGDSEFVAKGGDACAWHNYTYVTSSKWITFTSLPYMPDSSRCYMNWVNSGQAGVLDGVTMVAGHEYAETITDPGLNAWYDAKSSPGTLWEDGDKCSTYGRNMTTSTGTFAFEATWSNYAKYHNGAGCVYR